MCGRALGAVHLSVSKHVYLNRESCRTFAMVAAFMRGWVLKLTILGVRGEGDQSRVMKAPP